MQLATALVERDGATITVVGDLDVLAAPALRTAGREAVEAGYLDITINMAQVPFLDAAGLGVLIGILRQVGRGGARGSVRLANPQPSVLRVLGLTGLDHVFTVESPEQWRAAV